jgi:hypothetical protein
VSLLGNRYKFEETVKHLVKEPASFFQEKFPSNFEEELEKSEELWLIGVTLSRTLKTHYSLLERKLRRGDSIKIILVNPETGGIGAETAEMRVYERSDVERLRSQIRGILADLCSLQKVSPNQLEIRTVNYPLGFGAFGLDLETADGILYLEHYPFKMPGGSIPKFVLQAKDGRWYDFFKLEMQMLWEKSVPWQCKP